MGLAAFRRMREQQDAAPVVDAAPDTEPPAYTVVKAGAWFKLLDAEGKQVGRAQRTEADARAQVSDAR